MATRTTDPGTDRLAHAMAEAARESLTAASLTGEQSAHHLWGGFRSAVAIVRHSAQRHPGNDASKPDLGPRR